MTSPPAERVLQSLQPMADPTIADRIRASGAPMPQHLIGGYLGRLQFVVSLDADGQIECSLVGADGKPKPSQVDAFYRKWGIPKPDGKPTPIHNGRGLHWVVRPKGVIQ